MEKKLIYNNQQTLYGSREVIGFGSESFYVKEIDRSLANDIVVKNHYSKKFYNATYIHLGVYINKELLGVLQYGYAMNPASGGSVVKGTKNNQYLELNRMWLDDKAERNSETMALAYSFRYIRTKYPSVKWIQSFADERCGGLGIVYQAASFGYYGEHTSSFWEWDNEIFHNIQMTVKKGTRRYTKRVHDLQTNKDQAIKHDLRQFRYLKFLDSRWKKRCLLEEKEYLKHYNND